MMVVPLRELVFVLVGSIVLSVIVLAAFWPWARDLRRLVVIGVACAVGILVWNIGLNVANATALNVDSDILGLSVQDIGSGVVAFAATQLALMRVGRGQPRAHILGASCVVGVLTILVDRFG